MKRTARKGKTSRKNRRVARIGTHPVHPRCECGRALYKSKLPARVATTDPWSFCRNENCRLFGRDQSARKRRAA